MLRPAKKYASLTFNPHPRQPTTDATARHKQPNMADTTSPGGGGTEPAPKKPKVTTIDAPLSLLSLGDPLDSILAQCDVVSVCRLEQTCKALGVRANSHVRKRWDRLDASVPAKFRSSVGSAGKGRFQRYYSARVVARKLEAQLEAHTANFDYVRGMFAPRCPGCSTFPEELCTDIYCKPEDFELFLRLSRKVGNKFHTLEPSHECEGFVEFRSLVDNEQNSSAGMNPNRPFCGRSIHFRLADYAPPRLKRALKYVAERKSALAERFNQAFVENEVKDIVMTLLAVHKETGKTELLTGVVGFKWEDHGGPHLEPAGNLARYMTDTPHNEDSFNFYVRTTVGKMLNWVSNDGECKVIIDDWQ